MDAEIDPDKPVAGPTLGDDLRQLIDDGRALAEAEVAWQKSRAVFAGSQAGGIAVFLLLAAVLGFCALMALTFGLVLALTPQLTAWGATSLVVGGLLIAALVAGAMAALRWRKTARLIADRRDRQ